MIYSSILAGKSLKKACFCVLLVFMLMIQVMPFRVTAQTTSIAIDPANSAVSLYQTFQVNITVTNVVNCTSWQFGLYYRNDVLSCKGVSEGSFLSSGGSTFFFVPVLNNAYNSTTGFVLAVCQLSPRAQGVPVDGSGLLAQVTFQAIGASSTALHLTQTILGDEKVPMAGEIPHTDLDGTVQVTGPQPDVYVSPSNLSGPPEWIAINGTFTINITIACAPAFDLNLNYWQIGMFFNPSVLECVNFTEGPFLQSAGTTVWQPGTIDNNAGVITPFGAHLGNGTGANGNGTLAYVSFRVKDTGSSSLVLQNVFFLDINNAQIPVAVHSGLFQLPPTIPKSPTAFFTYSPISPYVNDSVTFDATGSTANNVNGTIVKYNWNFGDSSQGQGMILNHVYSSAGVYNATLVVTDDRNLTGSFSEFVTVIAIPVGASIDVYTERGGKGLNAPSDTFGPEEEIIIYAYVTYDLVPVAGKVVTFNVNFPNGTLMQTRQIQSDTYGIAFIYFLVLAEPVFGKYNTNATVTVGTKTVSDVCEFSINWLVQVMSSVPCDAHGVPQSAFDIGEPFYLKVTIQNNRLSPTYILVSVTVQDFLTQWLPGLSGSQVYYVQPNQTVVLLSMGQIPGIAYPAPGAIAHTSARDMGGGQASPEIDSSFAIQAPHPNVAVVSVAASTSDTYVGHSVKITIIMLDRYLASQDCNVKVCVNGSQIGMLNIIALPPWQETSYVFVWFTDTFSQGYYTLSAVASPVPGEFDISDNTYIDGTIHLGPPIGMRSDISVTGISSEKNMVGKGYSTAVNVTLHNEGDYNEISNLTVYANQVPIPNAKFQMIALLSGQQTVVTFLWNTTGFNYGNYTLTAVLDAVPNETDLDDNTGYSQNIRIGVPGDVSGTTVGVPDGVTNMKDVAYLVSLFSTRPSSQNWNCNADVNNDGVCNMKDIAIAVYYFNQHT
jgi:hypothetical protein